MPHHVASDVLHSSSGTAHFAPPHSQLCGAVTAECLSSADGYPLPWTIHTDTWGVFRRPPPSRPRPFARTHGIHALPLSAQEAARLQDLVEYWKPISLRKSTAYIDMLVTQQAKAATLGEMLLDFPARTAAMDKEHTKKARRAPPPEIEPTPVDCLTAFLGVPQEGGEDGDPDEKLPRRGSEPPQGREGAHGRRRGEAQAAHG